MNRNSLLEKLIYGVAIVLSLLAVGLVMVAATQFTSTKLVYQGF